MKFSKITAIYFFGTLILNFLCNFLICYGYISGFITLCFLQIFITLLVLSPIGETILRFLFGCRELKTQEEKNKLLPLFNDVYKNVLKDNPNVNKKVKLYIEDNINLNAYALGTSSIIITRGSIEQLTNEEIKGLLSHEFGHIVNGDTLLFSVLLLGNLASLLVALFVKIIQLFSRTMGSIFDGMSGSSSYGTIFADFVFNSIINLLFLIALLIKQLHSRKAEYNADSYAVKIGYGAGLRNVLYKIHKIEFGGKIKILDRLKASHPDTVNRIEAIEKANYYN